MRIDLTGNRYERLLVLSFAGQKVSKKGSRCSMWNCICDCGSQVAIAGTSLKSGASKSCGCLQLEMVSERASTHRLTNTRTYRIWANMKTRCLNPNADDYSLYGARGISVCDSWLDFNAFYADMGECPTGYSIDRIDSNGNYEKSNCRWASNATQSRNKRNNIFLTFKDKTMCLKDWAKEIGIDEASLRGRLKRWSLEKSLSTPKKEIAA
jgi:hypothetical protein